MPSLRYLNTILTILTVLLGLHLWTLWSVSPAGDALSVATPVEAASPAGIPNAGSQRKQIVDEIKNNNRKLDELINLLKSGQARVRLRPAPTTRSKWRFAALNPEANERVAMVSTIGPTRTRGVCARGYTLVELLIVISILGLAAAVVVPHLIKPGSLQVQAAGRMIIADIMVAQNDAVAQQAGRRVIFEPTLNRYRLTDENDVTLGVAWKGGGAGSQNYVVDFSNDNRFGGVVIENVDFGGTFVLEFDDLGSPLTGGTVDIVFEAIRYRINVAPFTGRVTIDRV